MKHYDITVIGFVAEDHKKYPDKPEIKESLGGGYLYATQAMKTYLPDGFIAGFTKVGKNFREKFPEILDLFDEQNEIILNNSRFTTHFSLDYSFVPRKLILHQSSDPIAVCDIPDQLFQTKGLLLSPIANEFNFDFFEQLTHKLKSNTLVGLDIQGLLRYFGKDGIISLKCDFHTKMRYLGYFNSFGTNFILKMNLKEARIFSGKSTIQEICKDLATIKFHLLITDGINGLYYKFPEETERYFPAYKPNQVLDETGSGDCFLALLMLEIIKFSEYPFQVTDYYKAISIASAGPSFLVEQSGLDGFQHRDVILARVKTGKKYEKTHHF